MSSAKSSTKKATAAAAAKTTTPAPATTTAPVAPKTVEKPQSAAAPDYNKLERDIRLVPIDKWDWSRVVYAEPQKFDIKDGSGHFRRVRIQYMYDDKTIGPAIVGLGKHYCFGVQPDNTDKDGKILKVKNPDGKEVEKPLTGYRVPIVMTSQSKTVPDPTPEEERELNFFEDWRNELVKFVLENKVKIGKGSKTDPQLEGMISELLYFKKDQEGNIVEGNAPKLYTNLIYYRNSKEVGTTFYGPGDKQIDPLSVTGHFHMYPNIRFDGIFIGGKSISLQHHVYDATIEPMVTAPKKRLARPNSMAAGAEEDLKSSADPQHPMMESEDEGAGVGGDD